MMAKLKITTTAHTTPTDHAAMTGEHGMRAVTYLDNLGNDP
ncbi:hypothetical protein [Pseudoscardovia suis]